MTEISTAEERSILEELEDRADLEAAEAALAESDERVSYEDLRRELGLEPLGSS